MPTDRELMQQALDALTKLMHEDLFNPAENAIEALRARLAQPEPKVYSDIDEMFRDMGVPVTEPEPVAWMHPEWNTYTRAPAMSITPKEDWIPLYTAPPQREWQGLTDEQIEQIEMSASSTLSAIYLAEAQLKGKNT